MRAYLSKLRHAQAAAISLLQPVSAHVGHHPTCKEMKAAQLTMMMICALDLPVAAWQFHL